MNIEDLRPADTPDYMTPAWIGCISWAISTPEIVETFRQETGMNWKPGLSPLERMIDEATGADRAFIEAFIKWVNVEIWGPMDGGLGDEKATASQQKRPTTDSAGQDENASGANCQLAEDSTGV